ncbi:thioesterase, FlK family [Thermotalea metallivorans]|uniref:Fluoroacetyl-CoA-specific thioesterase-like domain-containing protein n=1 Tax=Thermotalea metallivorans TaxID=520762 RepID=A0A140L799_9FIRM|nr:hypothetical protein [Thermotalea metallivorans]KXG76424.1 hypothetical protein AN619_09550 [Thermotalea metallivorans]
MVAMEGFPGIIAGAEKTIQRRLEKVNTGDKFDCEELEKVIPISTLTCCMVEAVLELVKNLLPDGYISIGSSFHSHYIHPTVAGMVATITAKLISAEGKKCILKYPSMMRWA